MATETRRLVQLPSTNLTCPYDMIRQPDNESFVVFDLLWEIWKVNLLTLRNSQCFTHTQSFVNPSKNLRPPLDDTEHHTVILLIF